jgi:hypothetical protein
MGEASTLTLLRSCVRTLNPIISAARGEGLVNIDQPINYFIASKITPNVSPEAPSKKAYVSSGRRAFHLHECAEYWQRPPQE